jgi:hypothetical protein
LKHSPYSKNFVPLPFNFATLRGKLDFRNAEKWYICCSVRRNGCLIIVQLLVTQKCLCFSGKQYQKGIAFSAFA